jgi:hypothetical protein
MAALLTLLTAIWTTIWSFISPIKWYVLTAVLSIVIWQKAVVDQDWFKPATWDATATVVDVDSATAITVNHVSSDVLNRKRQVVVQGVLMDAATLNKLLPGGTTVTIHVSDGNKLGAGQLTGIVDVTGGK